MTTFEDQARRWLRGVNHMTDEELDRALQHGEVQSLAAEFAAAAAATETRLREEIVALKVVHSDSVDAIQVRAKDDIARLTNERDDARKQRDNLLELNLAREEENARLRESQTCAIVEQARVLTNPHFCMLCKRVVQGGGHVCSDGEEHLAECVCGANHEPTCAEKGWLDHPLERQTVVLACLGEATKELRVRFDRLVVLEVRTAQGRAALTELLAYVDGHRPDEMQPLSKVYEHIGQVVRQIFKDVLPIAEHR